MKVNKLPLIVFLLVLSLISTVLTQDIGRASPLWKWNCTKSQDTEKCVRIESKSAPSSATSLTTCQLVCGPYGSLMPKPTEATLGKDVVYFLPSQIQSTTTTCENVICGMLNNALNIAKSTIVKYHPRYEENNRDHLWEHSRDPGVVNHRVMVHFSVSGTEEHITLETDESYKLLVTTEGSETKVMVTANTYFGARHALETLTQLIDYDDDRNSLQVVTSATINDRPVFPHRGLLIDTARNFLPVKNLRRIVDAMSYNKLNTFHWHITETQSFPMQMKAFPKLTSYGAYSPSQVYSAEDVMNLVDYARIRGIKVLPELDAPAHTGNGWQWGEEDNLGKLVLCLDQQPWTSYCVGPPCGQLNLANPNIYKVLREVYKEMFKMFGPVEMFHFGGDEIHLNCWNASKEMYSWMTENNFGVTDDSYYKQWSIFQDKVKNLVTEANRGIEIPGILWTSSLTENGRSDIYLDPSKYIIQVWTKGDDPLIAELLQKKFKIIMSNYDALYLDCGVSSWVSSGTNWCSPYKGWQDIYDNDIQQMIRNITNSNSYDNQLLGAEATAWSEQIDQQTIDARLWPRGAALAERLWSNPKTDFSVAEHRMLLQRKRLVTRGIPAERLQPEWCEQRQGECPVPWKPPTISAEVAEQNCISMASESVAPNLIILVFATIKAFILDSS